jgi:D-alanine--poly(phosphoribitol) ligase subunit 2
MERNEVLEIVLLSIDELNDEFNMKIEKSEKSTLMRAMDSIILVNLLVLIESKIEGITIADDKAFSQKNSPFLTVGSLIDYVTLLSDE